MRAWVALETQAWQQLCDCLHYVLVLHVLVSYTGHARKESSARRVFVHPEIQGQGRTRYGLGYRCRLGLQITVTKRPINALIKTALILVITL
jgi:hypothetical protein